MRILLVEDDELFLKLVSTLVSANAGPVDAVLTGLEGLALLRTNEYDVLITDLLMEGLNGVDLIRLALTEQLIDSHHILALTAEQEDSPHLYWVRRHGIRVLHKPFTAPQFADALRAISSA